MKSSPIFRKQAQAGFTLIELVVVIVILGILAATALPRMFDMSGQARLAKMQAALGAVRASSATAHAAWLMNGGLYQCATGTCPTAVTLAQASVTAEGQTVNMIGGFPDVGDDGIANAVEPLDDPAGGIVTASGLPAGDYELTSRGPGAADAVATNNNFSVAADAAHPNCRFTYTEATQNVGTASMPPTMVTAPVFTVNLLTLANCS